VKTWSVKRWLALFFPAVGLQRKRKNIAGRKESLAVKMRGGWKPTGEENKMSRKLAWTDEAWKDYLFWQTQDTNRLVYAVNKEFLTIISCRYHY
jgi:toxin YoeB